MPTVTQPGRMLWSSPNSSSRLLPETTKHTCMCQELKSRMTTGTTHDKVRVTSDSDMWTCSCTRFEAKQRGVLDMHLSAKQEAFCRCVARLEHTGP